MKISLILILYFIIIRDPRTDLHYYKDIDQFASVTHGYVGADLESLVKEAALVSLHRKIELQKESPDNRSVPPRVCKEGKSHHTYQHHY